MKSYRDVTEEEFFEYIKNYPRKLERNVTQICDPPNVNYNDFTTGEVWPESVVGSFSWGKDDPRMNNKHAGFRIYTYWEKLGKEE